MTLTSSAWPPPATRWSGTYAGTGPSRKVSQSSVWLLESVSRLRAGSDSKERFNLRYRTRSLTIAASACAASAMLMLALPTPALAHSTDDDGDRTRTEDRNETETRNRGLHESEGLLVLRCGERPLISISL